MPGRPPTDRLRHGLFSYPILMLGKHRFIRAIGVVLGGLLVFACWFSVASNYGYKALAGTYEFSGSGEKCNLRLLPDGSFVQKLESQGTTKEVRGRWYRYGEAHVSFSNEFIAVSGEEPNAAGETHGQFNKKLGIFPSLTLAPFTHGPLFRRKLFVHFE